MQPNKKAVLLSFACLIVIIACARGAAVTDRMLPTPTATQPGIEIPSSFTPDPMLAPTGSMPSVETEPSPSESPPLLPAEPALTFFVEPGVPRGIWGSKEAPAGMTWSQGDGQNVITLGETDRMPDGQVALAEIEWVFALAAPFKTIQDDVTLADLQAAWLGNPQGSGAHLTALAVYERDHASLAALLGVPPGADGFNPTIHLLPDDTENIGDFLSTDTWALIPFDKLQPELKVISIDGISPLDDDFPMQAYPLRGHYILHTSPATADRLLPEILDALLANLPVTNRDPARMTSLVMSGVTALVRATAYRMETQGIIYPARDIGDWLSSADVTHISNEVSFYENCPYPDPYDPSLIFCSHPDYIGLLDYVSADVIELTGNHNNDASRKFNVNAFDATLAMYDTHGMLTFGGGMNLEDAMQPAVISHHGNNLAFIGCNIAGPDFAWATSTSGGAAPCGDLTWMVDTIQSLRQSGYLPIVTMQYYEDYSNDASSQMRADFRRMAEAGAVIVNGSQAHRPKEMEILDGVLLHYGLGNLFFDQMSVTVNGVEYTQTRNEFIQRHIFYDGRYISTELLTAVLEDWAKPRPMTLEERQVFLSEIFSVSP